MNKKDGSLYFLFSILIIISAFIFIITSVFSGSVFKTILLVLNYIFIALIVLNVTALLTVIKTKDQNTYYFIYVFLKKVTLPFIIVLLDLLKKDSNKYKQLYININNKIILRLDKKYSPDEILLLMPHCLQSSKCIYNISHNIGNCAECGACDINDLKFIFRERKIHLAVATGGTAARNTVRNIKPKFIIASACERDLFSGLYEIKKIPVFGLINERPFGPCRDTKINIKKLREVLKLVME